MDLPRGFTLEQAHAERINREMADLRQQVQQLVQAFNGVNIQNQPRRRRGVEVETSSDESGGSSRESEVDPNIVMERGRRRRDNRPQQQQPRREEDFKVDFPNFEGNLNPDDFLDWLRSMEMAFEYNTYDDEKKFKVATLRFKGYASLWWDTLKAQRVREGKTRIRSWEKLKRLMKRRFLPDDYKQDLYLKLTHLQQERRTVEEYTREFDLLHLRCDVQEPQERTIVRFVHGLNEDIASKVELQSYWTLDDVKKLAIKVEKQNKAGKKPYTRSYNSGSSFNPKVAVKGEMSSNSKRLDTKVTTTAPTDLSTKKKCFKCHGFGHFQVDCPNRRVMTIQEIQEIEEEMKQESLDLAAVDQKVQDEEEEVVEQPDHGEMLVIRRVLHSIPIVEEAQRENIFQSRCTVKGKVCNLIIDSGSCANVASSTLVEKLSLPTTKHKQPYKLKWLNDSKLQVSKQVLISFSIGKNYQDEVLCDVIPMDACHLLLGRPWEFDRRAMHDGYKNTYSFYKDKKHITLAPLVPTLCDKTEPEKSCRESLFLGESRVVRKLDEGKEVFALLVVEKSDGLEVMSTHPMMQKLIKEYSDVFPEDLPPGLPPIRGIEHQIDLQPGAPLPNRPAYRCNPEEAKELQRQVQELIARGYVRESMSPCSVPALLVPKKDGSMRMCVDSR